MTYLGLYLSSWVNTTELIMYMKEDVIKKSQITNLLCRKALYRWLRDNTETSIIVDGD